MKTGVVAAICGVLALSAGVAGAAAQAPSAQTSPAEAASEVEPIVVTARRSGAPMWTVTAGDSTVLLVGAIDGVPRSVAWRPDALEAATLRADRILLGTGVQGSLGDILRLIWRSRTLTRLPEGRTSADYLSPEWQARLDALEARYRVDHSRKSFLLSSRDLLTDQLDFDRDTADDAGDVVRRAARKARIPVRAVTGGRGDQLVEDLLTAPPERLVPCMQAAIEATEAGAGPVQQRGEDWTRFRVRAVLDSPLEKALGRCWPWGDPTIGPQLRAAWIEGIDKALAEHGVTMAVAPLNLGGGEDGVLDRLKAKGLEVSGPDWR